MKKYLSIFAALILCLFVSGCDATPSESNSESSEILSETSEAESSTPSESSKKGEISSQTESSSKDNENTKREDFVKVEKIIRSENETTFVAEICNVLDNPIYIGDVTIDMEDKDGNPLGTMEYIGNYPSVLNPGESSYICTYLYLDDKSVSLDDVETAICHFNVYGPDIDGEDNLNVEISKASLRKTESGYLKAVGKMTNNESEDIIDGYMVIPIRDKNGELQTVLSSPIEGLGAGQTKGFEAEEPSITGSNPGRLHHRSGSDLQLL